MRRTAALLSGLCLGSVSGVRRIRVGVLGAGAAGCAAAGVLRRVPGVEVVLLEMGRGVGGRATTRGTREDERIQVDHGAPAAEFVTTEGLAIAEELVRQGYARETQERRGVLKAMETGADDGFVYSEAPAEATSVARKRFVGYPTMNAIAQGLLDLAKPGPEAAPDALERCFSTMVRQLEPRIDAAGMAEGWVLRDKDGEIVAECDWLVISGATVAHPRWSELFGGEAPLRAAANTLEDPDLSHAVERLGGMSSKPVQIAMMAFTDPAVAAKFAALPFAVAEVEGDPVVAKVVVQRRDDVTCVVVHSTHSFAEGAMDAYGSTSTAARIGGARSGGDREAFVLNELMAGLRRCVPSDLLEWDESHVEAAWGPFLHRWGSAFPSKQGLSEDEIFLPKSRLAFCGDYVGQRWGTLEGAVLAGRSAAQRLLRETGLE